MVLNIIIKANSQEEEKIYRVDTIIQKAVSMYKISTQALFLINNLNLILDSQFLRYWSKNKDADLGEIVTELKKVLADKFANIDHFDLKMMIAYLTF